MDLRLRGLTHLDPLAVPLPNGTEVTTPDVSRADALLRRIREEVARRHLDAAPGPLGARAPPPPVVVWDEGDDRAQDPGGGPGDDPSDPTEGAGR